MPTIDSTTGSLVVRIAYDGPPLAGKTATLRALGALLDRPVQSMDEAYGRTLWFDWMRYDGGMYEGSPIECEVVAIPGQSALEPRRRRLLDDTDAVVFVADCSRPGHDGTVAAMTRHRRWLSACGEPPALVVQANKRDLPGSWDVPRLRAELGLADGVPVVESVATDAVGVRRAFIVAVGRAVRRADELRLAAGQLPSGTGPRTVAQLRAGLSDIQATATGRAREGAHGGPAASLPERIPAPANTGWETTW